MAIFCSQELAARIERDEVDKLAAAVVAARRRDPAGLYLAEPLAGGRALWGGPHSPLNKVAGLGFGGAIDSEELAAVEQAFRERGTPVRVELANLGDPEIGRLLTGRGYLLVGYENVLAKTLSPGPLPAADGIEVAMVAANEEDAWLDTVVDGFAAPDSQGVAADEEFPRDVLAQVIGDLNAAADYTRYLARIGGRVAGGASLRMAQGLAQMSGAATLPAFRRRGVQSALVARRLHDAANAGCELAVVTTAPGSKSQQNAQKQGFDLLYTRAVLVLGEIPPG